MSLGIILLISCAQIFNGTVLPNQCKRCDLYNNATGEIIWSTEGCGSENTRLEEKCKVQAYEMSRGNSNLSDLECKCESWKKEPEESTK